MERDGIFLGKEIVLRIITLPQIDESSKKSLIFSISSATNSQTAVSAVDRSSSNDDNREIAELVFRKTGILYEPKRGEYSDALRNNYVVKDDIIERSLFSRLMHTACGQYELAVEKKMMRNTGGVIPKLVDHNSIDIFLELYEIYRELSGSHKHQQASRIANDLAFTVFVRSLRLRRSRDGVSDFLPVVIEDAKNLWIEFLAWGRDNFKEFQNIKTKKNTGEKKVVFYQERWKKSSRFPSDVDLFVSSLVIVTPADEVI